VTGDCLCLTLGIECWCTRPGPGGAGYAAHGTLAAARRHYRHDGRGWQCGPCKRAERADARARAGRRPSRSKAAKAARAAVRRVEEIRAEQEAVQAARRAELAAALPSCNQYHREAAAA